MPRPDPALLDVTRYPFRHVLNPRFADLDVNHHLNNVAIVGLMQEARVRLHEKYAGLPDSRPFALIVANLSIDYLSDGTYPAAIEVFGGIAAIGRTSHTIEQLMLQEGRAVALLRTVMVRTDRGVKMENDPALSAAMKAWTMRS